MENMEPNAKMGAGVAMNTTKAYASDLSYIQQWVHLTFGSFSFPMTEDIILLFITDHLQGMEAAKEKQLMSPLLRKGYKAKSGVHSLATVRRRLSALTIQHKERGYNDPCSGNTVKYLLHTMPKTEKKTVQQKAVTKDILEKLLTVCDDSIKGMRDKAILLLAWTTGGRRCSEIIAAQVEHLTSMGDDFLLHIPTHNPKRGYALDISVKGRTAQALRDWMRVAAVRQGIIFRAVNKRGKVSCNPLSPIDVNRIVKNRCKAAGLNEKQFGVHSLRLGFLMQEATEQVVLADFLAKL
jgi:integrase